MDELAAYRNGLLSALEGIVPELSRIAEAISSNAWHIPKKPGAHTPHYILAHLCVLEAQAFNPLLQRIVSDKTCTLPRFDDNAWMSSHYEPTKPAQVFLEEFIQLRRQELHWLRSLAPQSWSRTARHPWWGVHTFQWWVELQLEYSRQHIEEITAVLAL
jgi:hypothetical protein